MTSSRRGQLATAVCCLVAALAYAGAVKLPALGLYVLPSVAAVSLVAASLERRIGARTATTIAAVIGLGLAQVANATSGELNGPVARSTFLATLGTAVAVAAAGRALLVVVCGAVTFVLAGAMFLGAAGEVLPVVVLTVVLLVLTLPTLEHARRRTSARSTRRIVTPLLALAAGAAAFGVGQLQLERAEKAPVVFEVAQIDEAISPPVIPALPVPSPGRSFEPTPSSGDDLAGGATRRIDTSRGLALTGALLALLVAVVLVRLLVVALAWRRLRRRLSRGSPERATAGAWSWALLRLRSYGVPLSLSVPVDSVADGSFRLPVGEAAAVPLREAARSAARAAFSYRPDVAAGDSREAWRRVRAAARAHRAELPRWRRAVSALQRPPRVARH